MPIGLAIMTKEAIPVEAVKVVARTSQSTKSGVVSRGGFTFNEEMPSVID